MSRRSCGSWLSCIQDPLALRHHIAMALPISHFYFIPFIGAVNTQLARMYCPSALRLSSSVNAQMVRLCTGATNYFGLGFSKTDPEKHYLNFYLSPCFSILRLASSKQRSSISIPIALRYSRFAVTRVVPLPRKGSRITPSLGQEDRIG